MPNRRTGYCVLEERATVSDSFAPIKGKCTWWRETPVPEDVYDPRLKEHERRVNCSCFVEGKAWTFTYEDAPSDCPDWRYCRYHIKHL